MNEREELIKMLAQKAIKMSKSNIEDIERLSWMVVHEHHHGVMPVEYDIREINERLYLDVLSYTKNLYQD